ARTSALDRLAAEGIVFDQHYADHPDSSCACQFSLSTSYHFDGYEEQTSPILGDNITFARIVTSNLELPAPDRGYWHLSERIEVGRTPDADLRKVTSHVVELANKLPRGGSWLVRVDVGTLLATGAPSQSSSNANS